MPAVLVQFSRRRCHRARLLPRQPEDEQKRDGRKHRPRHFGGAARRRYMRIATRDHRGSKRRPENERLRHEDGSDAGDQENRRKHGRNLTRLASPAGDDRPS